MNINLKFLKIFTNYFISIASPHEIIIFSLLKNYNSKEIISPYTFSKKTGLPYLKGIFCEFIFGPLNLWNCNCNTYIYNLKNFKNKICTLCNTKITLNLNRRYQTGYILLNSYFINKLYLNETSYLTILCNKSLNQINYLIYFKHILLNKSYLNLIKSNIYIFNNIELIQGTFLLYKILNNINILFELNKLRNYIIIENNYIKKYKLLQKIRILNLFFITKLKPEWLLISIISILPPSLRPIYFLTNKKILISILNKIYINIIIHNNKLFNFLIIKKYISIIYIIIEKKFIQLLLDNLFYSHNNINLITKKSSLLMKLTKKTGRFRSNILGKRVDFSARSIITSGPFLPLYNIGLPFNLSLELFKPFIIKELKSNLLINSILKLKYLFKYNIFYNRLILFYFQKKNFIIFNRAPTLHKFNIQASLPIFVENSSINLHPLLCKGLNADFDGDQIGIFLPLSNETQIESKLQLFSIKNILHPIKGNNLKIISQNMNLGIYTLFNFFGRFIIFKNKYYFFSNYDDILNIYYSNILLLNKIIWFRKYIYNKNLNKYILFFLLTILNRINLFINLYN